MGRFKDVKPKDRDKEVDKAGCKISYERNGVTSDSALRTNPPSA